MGNSLVGAGVVIWLFLMALGVLWFFLPFAVFGTKPKLDKILLELQTLNKTLKDISTQNRVLVEQQKLLMPRSAPPPPKDPDEHINLAAG